jgi:hypothetical protein
MSECDRKCVQSAMSGGEESEALLGREVRRMRYMPKMMAASSTTTPPTTPPTIAPIGVDLVDDGDVDGLPTLGCPIERQESLSLA